MKKRFMVLFFSLMAARAGAVDGVFVEGGHGYQATMSRVGLLWNWDRSWLNDGNWHVTGFWEACLGRWRGEKPGPGSNNQTITEVGITPVFRFEQKELSGVAPYLEGGFIGLHLISPTYIYGDRRFGSAFQFGDHLGVGVRFGEHHQFDLGLRYQHLSNGDIRQPNNGINFSQVHFVYHF